MIQFFKGGLLFLVFASSLISCVNQKKYIYFQPKEKDTQTTIVDNIPTYNNVFHVNDIVSIMVSSIDPEAVRPFNLLQSVGSDNKTSQPEYLIDADGNIEFPVLGTIKIAGLNRIQTTNLLKERLKDYVKNPIVNVRFLSFKVTILGEVVHPNVFQINNDKLSLPEALGLAGDIPITGEKTNVLIIREEEGKKIEYKVDLTSRDVFKSPVYYLHPNDIVYVSPTKAKINTSKNTLGYVGIGLSSTSLIFTIINLLKK